MFRKHKIERKQKGNTHGSTQHFIQQRVQRIASCADALVAYREQRGQRGPKHPHGDTQPVARIKMKNQPHSGYGDQAEGQFPYGNAAFIEQGFQKRGKKTHRRKADHADGHVGRLDAAVKTDPVQGKQQPRSPGRKHVAQGAFPEFASEAEEGKKHEGGKQQTIPDQQPLVSVISLPNTPVKPASTTERCNLKKALFMMPAAISQPPPNRKLLRSSDKENGGSPPRSTLRACRQTGGLHKAASPRFLLDFSLLLRYRNTHPPDGDGD